MANILLLAALEDETSACFPDITDTRHIGPYWLRRGRVGAHDISIATTGIGMVNCAAASATFIHMLAPQLLLLAGTCGRMSNIKGDIFWVESAVHHGYGTRHTGGFVHYRSGTMPFGAGEPIFFTAMEDPGCNLAHARMASGDNFIGCADAAAQIVAATGADIVDMETAAMAQVASRAQIPWGAIKAPTDDADAAGGADFSANLHRAAALSADAIARLVTAIP